MDALILLALALSLLLNLALIVVAIRLFRVNREAVRAERRADGIARRDTSRYFKAQR